MASLEDLSRVLTHMASDVEKNAANLVRKAALAADQAVVSATPVDTGRARSNWIVSINVKVDTVREPLAPGVAATGPAIAEGQKIALTYKPGDSAVYIQNSVPYIKRLNEGWSKQAPANFISKAVHAGLTSIKGLRLLNPAYK